MVRAVVLINCDRGWNKIMVNKLRRMESVKDVMIVYGVYDLVVILESKSMPKIKRTVTEKVRGLKEITSTVTMIVAE